MPHLESLLHPDKPGVLRVPHFMGMAALSGLRFELEDPQKVSWQDSHAMYRNQRGVMIVQNHDTFALKLSAGEQATLSHLPHIQQALRKIVRYIRALSITTPSLQTWQPDELSVHRYDDQEIGLSFHKDNARFWGVIAIVSIDGISDLAVRNGLAVDTATTYPGDLLLLRAAGLIESTDDLRPEHAVVNLQTPTRTSLMVRANNRPAETIPGFTFNNWAAD